MKSGQHAYKGGNWATDQDHCYSSSYRFFDPDYEDDLGNGFRILLELN